MFILKLAAETAAAIPPIRRNASHLLWECHPYFPHQCCEELTLPRRWEYRRRASQLVHRLSLLADSAGRAKQNLSPLLPPRQLPFKRQGQPLTSASPREERTQYLETNSTDR